MCTGLEKIHLLTSSGNYSLRVDLWDVIGTHIYAQYNTFYIDGASANYTLHIAGYSGTAGDSMLDATNPNGNVDKMAFTTFDRDNDRYSDNCATTYKGAWWYSDCSYANLNGLYHDDGRQDVNGVRWSSYGDDSRTFLRAEMKMRPRV